MPTYRAWAKMLQRCLNPHDKSFSNYGGRGKKQPDDWRVVFFPWQDDPAYSDPEPQALTEETLRYFSDKPGFSLGQMSWYQRARDQYGMFIKREFPTVLEECFQTPIEGAIYAEIIDKLRAEGAIRPAVVDTSSLVHTAWDLGRHRHMVSSARRRRDSCYRLRS